MIFHYAPDMQDWINAQKLSMLNLPEYNDYFQGSWISMGSSNTDIGWTHESMLCSVGDTRVGWVSWNIDRGNDQVDEVGVCIIPRFLNTGAGIVAAAGLLNYLFVRRRFRRVEFHATNSRAFLYEGCGINRTGTTHSSKKLRDGTFADFVYFELFPDSTVFKDEKFLKLVSRVKYE